MPIRSLEDFHRLPTINKQIMMDHFDGINTCGLKLAEVMEFAVEKELNRDFLGYFQDEFVIGLSSGTSGNKGIFVTPKELTRRLPFVFLARSGIPLRLLPFRILFLLRVFSQGFADIHAPFIHLHYMATMTPVPELLKAVNDSRINILMAPPSLVRLILPHREKILKPLKMIVCYAEVLEEEEKQRFQEAFGVRVIEIYQASEGQIGSACRCGNLHVNEDLVYVELFDEFGNPVPAEAGNPVPAEAGNPVPARTGNRVIAGASAVNPVSGDAGGKSSVPAMDGPASRMLVTNLVNFAQPLIRYEMNDLLVPGGKCPCGSSFRTIRKILGRRDDVIWLRNNRHILQHVFPDLVSRWIITGSSSIREFQVVQASENALRIAVELTEDGAGERESVADALTRRMKIELERFDVAVEVEIVFEDIKLPADMSKYKRFISLAQPTDKGETR
jgi:phenylacetate-coenzyme A ligase PaaK-like adenylate-forming protein